MSREPYTCACGTVHDLLERDDRRFWCECGRTYLRSVAGGAWKLEEPTPPGPRASRFELVCHYAMSDVDGASIRLAARATGFDVNDATSFAAEALALRAAIRRLATSTRRDD